MKFNILHNIKYTTLHRQHQWHKSGVDMVGTNLVPFFQGRGCPEIFAIEGQHKIIWSLKSIIYEYVYFFNYPGPKMSSEIIKTFGGY